MPSPFDRALQNIRDAKGSEPDPPVGEEDVRAKVEDAGVNLGESYIDAPDEPGILEEMLEQQREPIAQPYGGERAGQKADYPYGEMSINNLVELQMHGIDVDWKRIAGDMNIIQDDVPITPEDLAIQQDAGFDLLRKVGRQGAVGYLETASGILEAFESGGSMPGMALQWPRYEEDFAEMQHEVASTDAPLARAPREMAHQLEVTPEEFGEMDLTDRIAVGIGALVLELPLIVASMTYTAPVRGGTTMTKAGPTIGRYLKIPVPNQKTQGSILAGLVDAAAEGVAFGNLALIENNTPKAELDKVAWEYVWSVATGFAFGVGGQIGHALQLPVVASSVPGGVVGGTTGAAQNYAEQAKGYMERRRAAEKEGVPFDETFSMDHKSGMESFIEGFATIFALGLMHEPRRVYFEKKVKEYAAVIKERETAKEKAVEAEVAKIVENMDKAETAVADEQEAKGRVGGEGAGPTRKETQKAIIDRVMEGEMTKEDIAVIAERAEDLGVPVEKLQELLDETIAERTGKKKDEAEEFIERRTKGYVEPKSVEEARERISALKDRNEQLIAESSFIKETGARPDRKTAQGRGRTEKELQTDFEEISQEMKKLQQFINEEAKRDLEPEPPPEEEITEPTEDIPPEEPTSEPEPEVEAPASRPVKEMTLDELKAERKAIQDKTPKGKGRTPAQRKRLNEVNAEIKVKQPKAITEAKEEKKKKAKKALAPDDAKAELQKIAEQMRRLEDELAKDTEDDDTLSSRKRTAGEIDAEAVAKRIAYIEGRKKTASDKELAELAELKKKGGKVKASKAKKKRAQLEKMIKDLQEKAKILAEDYDFGDFDPSKPERLSDVLDTHTGQKFLEADAIYKSMNEPQRTEFVREHVKGRRLSITNKKLSEWKNRVSEGEDIDLLQEGAPTVEGEGEALNLTKSTIREWIEANRGRLKREKKGTVEKIVEVLGDKIANRKLLTATEWLDRNAPGWKNKPVNQRNKLIRDKDAWPMNISEQKAPGSVAIAVREVGDKKVYTYATDVGFYKEGRKRTLKYEIETEEGTVRMTLGEAIVEAGGVPAGINTKGQGYYIGNGKFATHVWSPPEKGYFDWVPEDILDRVTSKRARQAVNAAAWSLGLEPMPVKGRPRADMIAHIRDILARENVGVSVEKPKAQDIADDLAGFGIEYRKGDDSIAQLGMFLSTEVGKPVFIKAWDLSIDPNGTLTTVNWVLGKSGTAGFDYIFQQGDILTKEERANVDRFLAEVDEHLTPRQLEEVEIAMGISELDSSLTAGESIKKAREILDSLKVNEDLGSIRLKVSRMPPEFRASLLNLVNMRGMRNLTELAPYSRYKGPSKGPVRHIGIGVMRGWIRDAYYDLRGKPINSAQDVADLGYLLRSNVEKFHMIAIKDGRVRSVEVGGFRSPTSTNPWFRVRDQFFVKKTGKNEWSVMKRNENGMEYAKDAPWYSETGVFERREVAKTIHTDKVKAFEAMRLANDSEGLTRSWLRELEKRAVKQGWDAIYFQHNHPGGSALVSTKDVETTAKYRQMMEEEGLTHLMGLHKENVITNHDNYSHFTMEQARDFKWSAANRGDVTERASWLKEILPEHRLPQNPWVTAEKPHESLYRDIEGATGRETVKEIARGLVEGQDKMATIILEDNNGRSISTMQIPEGILRDPKQLEGILRREMTQVGAITSHIYTTNESLITKKLIPMWESGMITNAIGERGEFVTNVEIAGERPTREFVLDSEVDLYRDIARMRGRSTVIDWAEQYTGTSGFALKAKDEKPKGRKPYYARVEEGMSTELPDWVVNNDLNYKKGKRPINRRQLIKDLEEISYKPGLFRGRRTIRTPTVLGQLAGKFAWRAKVGARTIEIKNAVDFENVLKAHGAKFADLIPSLDIARRKELLNMAPTEGVPAGMSQSRAGMAEWFHKWIVDRDLAFKEAPNLTKLVEHVLQAKELGHVRNYVYKMRETWNLLRQDDVIQMLGSFMSSRADKPGDNNRRWIPKTFDEAYTYYKDDLWPVIKLTRQANKAQKGGINPGEDPGVLGSALRGSMGRADIFLTGSGPFLYDGTSKTGMKTIGPSLGEILHDVIVQGEKNIFNIYLFGTRISKDAKLRKAYNEGMNMDFGKLTDEVVKKLDEQFPHFKDVRKQTELYNDNLLEYMKQSQWLDAAAVARMKKANAFYAPFHAIVEEYKDFPVFSVAPKQQRANLFNPLRKKTGKATVIYDPIESMFYNTMAMINTADANKVGVALWKLKDNPIMAETIRWIKPHSRPVIIKESEMRDLLRAKGVPEEVLAELSQEDLLVWRPNRKLKPNELAIRVGGKEKIMAVDDPLLFRALRGEPAADFHSGIVMKGAAKLAEIQRVTATSLSHRFLARNPFKDQIMAHIYSKFGYTPFVGAWRGGKERLKAGELWQSFNASGAAMAALNSMEGKHAMNRFKELTTGDTEGTRLLKNLYKNPYQFLREASELVENATRLEAFRKAMQTFEKWIGEREAAKDFTNDLVEGVPKFKAFAEKYGYDMERFDFVDALLHAGMEAKDITVDFSRKGTRGATLNRYVAFHNAHMEGSSKFIRAWKDQPGKTALRIAYSVTIPSLSLWWWQKDDPMYRSTPLWRRINMFNAIVRNPVNGEYWFTASLPKPFEPGVAFGTVPELWFDYLYTFPVGHPGKKAAANALKEGMGHAFGGLVPNVTPTAMVPLLEWSANKNFFYQRPLVPRDAEKAAAYLQYQPWTNSVIKSVAQAVAEVPLLGHLSKHKRSPLNPAKVENLIRGYTTGAGDLILGVTDRLWRAIPFDGWGERQLKPAPHPRDWFMFDAITARWPSPRSRNLEIFYDNYDKIEGKWDTHMRRSGFKGSGVVMDPTDLEVIDGKHWTYADGVLLEHYRDYHKEFSVWYKAADNIWSAPAKQYGRVDKRDMLDALYWTLNQVATQALGQHAVTATSLGAPELDEPNNMARVMEEFWNAADKKNIRLNEKYLRGEE